MSQKKIERFITTIKNVRTEEDVKFIYAKYFDISYDTSDFHDLYTPQVLFEFKINKNFKNVRVRSQIIAQMLYYVRRLKYGRYPDKAIPPFLCFADQNEAIITETSLWKRFYDNENYDWDLAPSIPDKLLIDDLSVCEITDKLHIYNISDEVEFPVFAEKLESILNNEQPLAASEKKVISEENFEDVFLYWNKIFGDAVRNGFKTSRYFVSDIRKDRSVLLREQSRVIFRVGEAGEMREKKILSKDYEHFWSLYERVADPDTIRGILAKIDRLTDETMRRFHGEFFTPIRFAKKALDYVEKTIGKEWWLTGEYRLWDMAAGTGNLEYHLPQAAMPYCYLSTLYREDVEHLEKLFPDAHIFQYDYLNDDVENVFADKSGLDFGFPWKLPDKLRNDLSNPSLKWIILINPPFATAQKAGTGHGDSKKGVSETKVRKFMHQNKLGEVSRELFAQFIYRIKYEFDNRQTHLALFSKIKYLNSNNDQNFRDKVFDFNFEKGFVFSSINFAGTSRNSQFPVGMLIWKVNDNKKIETQDVVVDVFNEEVEKTGFKIIQSSNRDKHLNKWITRPPGTKKLPPFGSAIALKPDNQDRRDRVSSGFLASLMCNGNDFQHANNTALLSGPYVSAGALSVIPENFEKAMIVHAARRIPKANWLNDRDQFMIPEVEPSEEFITDCTVWNLFSNSNQTAALKNVVYEGTTYQIHNHFFPFAIDEVKKWEITDSDIVMTLATTEDRFVSKWLAGKTLSDEAKVLLEKGKDVYRYYFANLNQLRTPKFKIETWDAGWWQIKQALNDVGMGKKELHELKVLHDKLKDKILPKLIEYKIIE